MEIVDHSHRESLGRRLREEREAQGLSLRRLEAMCGVSYKQIERIEKATSSATVDTLDRIAQALGVRVRDLIDF